jgi:alpha-D-xyloside xylohydrolase
MMRAMVVEFPGDPACAHLDRQYMLGDDLLVAPVFSADGEVSYYVPEGTWTHYLTGERVAGPRWVRERHGFDSLPLLVRPGAVLPVGAVDDRPDYDHSDGVTLRAYEPADGARVVTEIPALAGDAVAMFTTSRAADVVRVEAAGAPAGWRVLLAGVRSVGTVEGGTVIPHEDIADQDGVLVRAHQDSLLIRGIA